VRAEPTRTKRLAVFIVASLVGGLVSTAMCFQGEIEHEARALLRVCGEGCDGRVDARAIADKCGLTARGCEWAIALAVARCVLRADSRALAGRYAAALLVPAPAFERVADLPWETAARLLRVRPTMVALRWGEVTGQPVAVQTSRLRVRNGPVPLDHGQRLSDGGLAFARVASFPQQARA
jgi:hypothetical protein